MMQEIDEDIFSESEIEEYDEETSLIVEEIQHNFVGSVYE